MCYPNNGYIQEGNHKLPFTAQIEQIWVPDETLNVMVLRVENNNSQPIKIANYSLEARSPLNKEWKQIKRVKPLLSNEFYAEYFDSNNPTPKYLDFSKDSFDILAETKDSREIRFRTPGI